MGSLSEGKKLTQPDSGKDTPPDFRSLKEVPASYLRSEIDYNSFVNLIDSQAYVPVVDLADPNIIELVGRAFQTYGVFQVTNHGIHMGLIKDTEIEARRLFSLPAEQKLKALHPPDGSAGYGLTRFTPFFDRLMWNEGFSIMGSPIDDARKLWPDNYTIFCDVIEGYLKQMQELSMKLKRLILASLGLTTEEDLKMAGLGPSGEFTEGCITALQLNHYPPCPNPKQVMGLAAHTDTSMFTILYQGDISGLQVYREGVGWATVPPVPGAFVVNAGDLLHILSNGRFPTLVHRVLANPAHNRISLAYFYGPTPNAQIKPFSNLVEPGDVPRYCSMLWGEYINTKAKHIGKALSLVSNIEQKQTQEGGCLYEEVG
ncbi:gibberellin 3-beta-dioxygenase 1-like [Macadamia integrifolia]|uniref:gibberellin 3-beta-dioxygenase 1-like n=1 Tax=Macadamia integrifolia TaxID=60698 RepID=UPI001C4E666C|nr:gibberellin 3-beta-dioxygenase 1-like [Macadamia integrifolia]